MGRFAIAMVVAWGINTGALMSGLVITSPALPDAIALNMAKVIATAASFVVGFAICRSWAFGD